MRTAIVIAASLACLGSASAHDWYELGCCGGSHCGPVADGVVVERKDGVSVQGFGTLSYSDPRLRWSRDDRDHVCSVGDKLLCVYRKPKGM